MSFYIKPKFKVGQTIFSIKKDEIVKIEIESIAIHGTGISYLSRNSLFLENQSFGSKEEAEDFLLNSIRLPFINGDFCWMGNLSGVSMHKVKSVTCFFKDDLKKPYNITVETDTILNATDCFETQIEATEESLKQAKQFYNKKELSTTN